MARRRLSLVVAGLACAFVVAGVAVLWKFEGGSLGISVGLPAAATLLTSIVAWASSARNQAGQSTAQQVDQARQALAERAIMQLNGPPQPRLAGPPLPPRSATLPARWTLAGQLGGGGHPQPHTVYVAGLCARLRGGETSRLVILGAAGTGKTVLARSLMAELLDQLGPADAVPVFLPLSTWDPGQFPSLRDWMARKVFDLAPELRDRSSYRPDIVNSLIYRGALLFVLDGLDCMPEELRKHVLTSDDLLRQQKFILTCRTAAYEEAASGRPIANAVAVRPCPVSIAEAQSFLQDAASQPGRWDEVFRRIAANRHSGLAAALAEPGTVYLANRVYGRGENSPAELLTLPDPDAAEVERHLLGSLLDALIPRHGAWAGPAPWCRDKARNWLEYLATQVCRDDAAAFSWGDIYRPVKGLHGWIAALRLAVVSALTMVVTAVVYRSRGHLDTYGVLTGAAYGFAVASACFFLAPARSGRSQRDFRPPAFRWWLGQKLSRSWPVIAASLATFILFAFMIGLRVALLAPDKPLGHAWAVGAADGAVAALVVGLGAVIARIPAPARIFAEDGTVRETPGLSLGPSIGLGIAFGLISGLLAVVKHQTSHGPTHLQALEYGIIMGLNFAVGAWLVSEARKRLISGRLPDPFSALQGERMFTLLASVILGLTFASAFGLDAKLQWTARGAIAEGLVGLIAGSLVSEWPLYVAAVTLLALGRHIPFRLMRFLEICRDQGVLLSVRQSYQFCADQVALGLIAGGEADVGDEVDVGESGAGETVAHDAGLGETVVQTAVADVAVS